MVSSFPVGTDMLFLWLAIIEAQRRAPLVPIPFCLLPFESVQQLLLHGSCQRGQPRRSMLVGASIDGLILPFSQDYQK